MATRTPRIMPTLYNLALAAATTITASSQETGLPVAFLRDPLPTRKWRSKLGWNVVTGWNDKIDFSEGGVTRVGTITPGNYATGALYATAFAAAMSAAPGHTNTYTGSYDPVTKFVTIARATGAAAVVFLFSTGANAVLNLSAHRDAGYTDVDFSGNSYTAGLVAYHSREWIRFDLGSAQGVTVGIAHLHNMGTGGTAKLFFKTTDGLAWTGAGAVQTLTGDDLTTKRILFFGSQSFRYVVLVLEDVQNSAGYSELGVPFVGTYWQPGRGFQPGSSRQAEALSIETRADQGALYIAARPSPKTQSIVLSGLGRTDRDAYQAIEDDHRHVFFAKDATGFPGADTMYGAITGSAPIKDYGPLGDLFSLEVSFRENLG